MRSCHPDHFFKKCPYCGVQVSAMLFASHERIHSNVLSCVCEKCGAGFYDSATLRQHLRRCDGVFKDNSTLREKLRQVHLQRRLKRSLNKDI